MDRDLKCLVDVAHTRLNHPLEQKLKPSNLENKYLLKRERAALEESDEGGEG